MQKLTTLNGGVHIQQTRFTKDVGDEIGERKSITYIFSPSGSQVDRISSSRGEQRRPPASWVCWQKYHQRSSWVCWQRSWKVVSKCSSLINYRFNYWTGHISCCKWARGNGWGKVYFGEPLSSNIFHLTCFYILNFQLKFLSDPGPIKVYPCQ